MSDETNGTNETEQTGPRPIAPPERSWKDLYSEKLRDDWGGTPDDVETGMALADEAIARLGMTQDEVDARVGDDPKRAVEALTDWRELGRGFRHLPQTMTAGEARIRRDELMSDRSFYEKLKAGDRVANDTWRAINHLASRARDETRDRFRPPTPATRFGPDEAA